ncbi:MAG: cytochrome d ubiquinol oxidase subunit II [Chitinophagaceae bacterium]|nr:cytochrome d ubiquinol oxidase subunit II [Chitinophagaceae bacterium]
MEKFAGLDLQTYWFLILGGLFSAYAILDGFDLGAGALHLFLKKEESRRIAMNAVGPVFDGNEVWLVMGGGALFAGFPVAYATALSAMYIPFIFLFVGLIWRTVAIEFRNKESMPWWRKTWDIVYTFSSISIAFTLGLILGNVVYGMSFNSEGDFTGNFYDLFNPYALITGLTAVALFMMHGAVYLSLKTEGRLFTKLVIMIRRFVLFFILTFIMQAIATIVFIPYIAERFKKYPWIFIFPLITVLSIANIPRLVWKKKYGLAFFFSSVTIASMFSLVALALYPNLLICSVASMHNINIYNAASSTTTLKTLLLIACIATPLVLTYTVFVFFTFKGKAKLDEHPGD